MLSVIIVNYFCHDQTSRAAASVLANRPGAQVLVHDNSVDPQEHRSLLECLPDGVEVSASAENLGFGRACSLAFAKAGHDEILLLNPDAYVLDDCIDKLAEFLHRTPEAGAVAPVVFWDRDRTWFLPPAVLPTPLNEFKMTLGMRWPWFGRHLSSHFRNWALRCNTSQVAVRQRMLSGGLMLLRRSAIEASGGLFDPDFFMYFEDSDLCLRIQKAGFHLYLLPAAQAVHEWCASPQKNDLGESSRIRYFGKNFSANNWLFWQKKLGKITPAPRIYAQEELGICTDAPVFTVPRDLRGEWVMELSPHPLFIPAFYFFGSAARIQLPMHLWERLGPGEYWVRIGDRKKRMSTIYHWQKTEEPSCG